MLDENSSVIALTLITISAFFVRDRDFAASFIYCLFSWVLFFVASGINNEKVLLLLSSLTDLVLIGVLYAVRQCSRSRLSAFLMPISIIGIVADITGYYMSINNQGVSVHNMFVYVYWIVILMLFVWHWRRDGNTILQSRFLRDSIRSR